MAIAATPVISPNGGSFSSQQHVDITASTPGAVIHYTKDGTDPTGDSPIYNGELVSLATGLQAKWLLDEISGNLGHDLSSNNNNLTFNGTPTWEPGFLNNCANLAGSKFGTPSIVIKTAQITYAGRLYLPAYPSSFGTFIGRNGNASEPISAIYIDDSGNIQFYINQGSGPIGLSGPVVALNTWTFIACTFDGTTMRIYVDNVEVASEVHAGSIDTVTDSYMGVGGISNGYMLDGGAKVDEIRIYDRALTTLELTSLYNNTPIVVDIGTTTIKALVQAAGYTDSAIASAIFDIAPPPTTTTTTSSTSSTSSTSTTSTTSTTVSTTTISTSTFTTTTITTTEEVRIIRKASYKKAPLNPRNFGFPFLSMRGGKKKRR